MLAGIFMTFSRGIRGTRDVVGLDVDVGVEKAGRGYSGNGWRGAGVRAPDEVRHDGHGSQNAKKVV